MIQAPLSSSQERFWFADQLGGGSAEYNATEVFRVSGDLNRPAVEQAFDAIVERHEILRTRFVAPDGDPVQEIGAPWHADVRWLDLSAAAQDERETTVRAVIRDDGLQPFDLSSGRLMRITVVTLQPREHLLIRTLHHIVADGWSQPLLNREFSILYEAFAAGRANPLSPPARQYRDFALRQRSQVDAAEMARGVSYWQQKLADLPAPLELPRDARPNRRRHEAGSIIRCLSADRIDALKRCCTARNATPYMGLMAIFAALLARYAAQSDVVIGSPVANRQEVELEQVIGCFINTLALRIRVDRVASFDDLLRHVREVAVEAYACQHVPFERVVQALAPARGADGASVFQVVFALQSEPKSFPLESSSIRIERITGAPATVRHDVEVHAVQRPEGMELRWLYDTDLFQPWRIEQMALSYEALLDGALTEPARRLSTIGILTGNERRQLLRWSDSGQDAPRAVLPELVERQVAERPDAVAVIDSARSWTYAQLNTRANRVARELIALGCGPEDVVAVEMPRSAEMIVALLAIVKAGAAYLPLDLEFPAPRRAFMLRDANARCVVRRADETGIDADLPLVGVPPLDAVDADEATPNPTDADRRTPLGPNNTAYVTYTSGSTGTPKGVIATHAGVIRLLVDPGYIRFDANDVLVHLAPLAFDASTFEIWGSLVNGARLALYPPARVDARELGDILARHHVTTLWLTSGLFSAVANEYVETLADVRQLITGGDRMDVGAATRLLTEVPECRLIHAYGPTETTTFATCHDVRLADCAGGAVPIGRPVPDTQVFVVDDDLELRPLGVPGELCIGGAGVARGYLQRPSLTAEKFVPNPYGPPGARMYRSGDVARWNRDGAIEFLGRTDNQVKIRGFRVEPGEVEAALSACDGVKDAVVVVRAVERNGAGDKRLIAYVAPDGTDVAAIRHDLEARLPGFMLPSAIVAVPEIPLTANGKPDRAALPEPACAAPDESPQSRTPEEAIVCGLFAEALGVEAIGPHDNFFECGGHSLMAVRIVGRLSSKLGRRITVRMIFETPTPAGLLEQAARGEALVASDTA